MKLDGKLCLITGGTKGIGAATAIELARRGADIAINGRNLDNEAKDVKKKIESLGKRCEILIGNMAHPVDAARCVHETIERLGGIDVLVHSAGGPVPGYLLDTEPETWYAAFDVHVHANFHLCRAAVPEMKKRGGGAIIMIGSIAGLRGIPMALPYGVVKGVLPHFARMLARQLADDNIRVNCISPGIVRTRFHDGMSEEQYKINTEQRIPLHREGTPDEIAHAIAMVVENDYITGEEIMVDGGITSRMA